MKKNIYNLIFIIFLNSVLCAQVGINTIDATVSLSILENKLNSIQDSILLRTSNSSNEDKFQLKNNGNLTLFNALMLDNNPGEVGNLLLSNGSSMQQRWTDSVKKGLSIQIFDATQEEVIPNYVPILAPNVKSFTNPDIILNIPTSIGTWNSVDNKLVIKKYGIFDISAGGNFYRTNNGPFSVIINVYDENDDLFYQTVSIDNFQRAITPILTIDGKKYNQIVFSSTSSSLILKAGYSIVAIYSTGGYGINYPEEQRTYMMPVRTFFNVVYSNIDE